MLVSRSWQNYRRTITRAVSEKRFQNELTSNEAQKRFLYHRKLVHLISGVYHDIDPALTESVVIAHFLQFQYLYLSVNLEFLPFTLDHRAEAKRTLQALEDESRKIVFQVIPDQYDHHKTLCDLFRFLNEHINKYRRVCSERERISRTTFEELVRPLASIFHLPVFMFSLNSGDNRNNEILKTGLDYYFLGKKIVSDIVDFKYDAQLGAWNYVQCTFDQKMMDEGILIDEMNVSRRLRYFFVTGVAKDLYENAISYFKKSLDCWDSLFAGDLKKFPEQDVRKLRQIIQTIDRLMEKATNNIEVVAG